MREPLEPHPSREEPTALFGPMDTLFLVLRITVLAGGLGWLYFAPLTPEQKSGALFVFLFYSFYISVLYVAIFFNPERIRVFYLVGMLFDLIFIFLLLMLTGGAASSFFIAFYILVALHSFYYGLTIGVMVSVASSLIYFISYVDSGYAMHWTDFSLRIIFMFILSISMGFLSGMRQRDREHISLLNRHLEESLDHLERAQQKLIESAKLTALGRMTRDVAHEIRNPLVSIGGFARKCMATIEPDSKEMRYVKIIVHEVERLEKILRDLLMFSRGPVRKPGEIHVPTLLEKGIQINLDDLREKGIDIVREIGENLPTLYGDAEQLEEAFANLIQNAVQAMNPTGVLTLRAAPESRDGGTSVRIEIQDTGEGMSEEILERIFDPFFTTKEGAEGTGLGLSVCRRIVEEHRGTIAVQSRPGEGSTFTILLPVLRSETVETQMEEKVE